MQNPSCASTCMCFCDPEQNSHLLDGAQFLSNQKGQTLQRCFLDTSGEDLLKTAYQDMTYISWTT